MNPDYSRRVFCCYRLIGIFAHLEQNLEAVAQSLKKDFGPVQKSPENFELISKQTVQNARTDFETKSRATGTIEGQEEDEVVEKIVHELDGLLVMLEKEFQVTLKVHEEGSREERTRDEIDEVLKQARICVENALNRAKQNRVELGERLKSWVDGFSIEPFAKPTEKERVVVSVDVSKYGYLSGKLRLKHQLEFHREILASIHEQVSAVGANAKETVIINTGDGAILFFEPDSLDKAVRFANNLRAEAKRTNKTILSKEDHYRFRVGITQGDVIYQLIPGDFSDYRSALAAGTPIALSVRLQETASAGGIFIDSITLSKLLNDRLRGCFTSKREITYKEHDIAESQPEFGYEWPGDEKMD